MRTIFYTSRVLGRYFTKEILCAHRLLRIRGNIGPILFVLYTADAESNRCRPYMAMMAYSTTATQTIHSFTSSFQSEWRPTDSSSTHPSLSYFWCTTLRCRRLLDYST